jgi:hypothetical protein
MVFILELILASGVKWTSRGVLGSQVGGWKPRSELTSSGIGGAFWQL